jgi:hypothetical protein
LVRREAEEKWAMKWGSGRAMGLKREERAVWRGEMERPRKPEGGGCREWKRALPVPKGKTMRVGRM